RLHLPEARQQIMEESEFQDGEGDFRLLHYLLARLGQVQSRKQLLEEVWKLQGSLETRTIDTHINRLRQKLGKAGEYLETVRGVGYRIRRPPLEKGALRR
ncbi:MAG TPA: winged helix-turn-helix domain-containing protein, partial [Myxococcaceae bacterium]|nr:winged helix-turn-helix domain-containing protein [Myxococcaceae bacterium]